MLLAELSSLCSGRSNVNALAQFECGRMLFDGLGVDRDVLEAAEYLKRAVEGGHPLAVQFIRSNKKFLRPLAADLGL